MSSDLATYQRLDEEVTALFDSIVGLARAARIPDEDEADLSKSRDKKSPGDLMEVLAEKTVFSALSCLGLIQQLKRGALLSDFKPLMEGVRSVRDRMKGECEQTDTLLQNMRMDLQAQLNKLERHYYKSQHRRPSSNPTVSPPLEELAALAMDADAVMGPQSAEAF